MKYFSLIPILILMLFASRLYAQQTALKTNVLWWGTSSPNGGLEVGLARRLTLELWGACNAWKFSNDMKLNHYLIQPEARFWFCRKFEGHFLGVHGHWGHYNIGQIPFISSLNNTLYRGDLYGGGLSYGYHWVVGGRWGIEATIGAGYTYLQYDKFLCAGCAEPQGHFTRHFIGPTRVGVSIIYFLR